MRIRRQLELGFGVVALGFGVGCLLVILEIGQLRPATDRLARDEAIADHAVRLERGARKLEAGACFYGRRQDAMAWQLMGEGREELATSGERLARLVRETAMAAAVEDIRSIAATVEAGTRASGATMDSRAEALRVKLESLVAVAHDRLDDNRARLVTIEQRIRRIVVFSMIALALVGLATAAFLARRVVRRLGTLAAGAARLGGGDLSGRIPSRGADELAELAHAFNQMAADLECAQARLVETQRLAAIGEVAVAVRHEVANPLQGLLGGLEVLRGGSGSPADRDELLAAMADEVVRIGDTLVRLGSLDSSATCTYVGDTRMIDLGANRAGSEPGAA